MPQRIDLISKYLQPKVGFEAEEMFYPTGDRAFCNQRDSLIQRVLASSEIDRAALEREQFNERANSILTDLSDNLSEVKGVCATDFIETVLKPAYALMRAMQSSRTAFHLAWPTGCNGQMQSPEELAKYKLRNVGTGGNGTPPQEVYAIHNLYPILAVNEADKKEWEILEPAVVLVSWNLVRDEASAS